MARLVPAISIIEAPPDHVETPPCPHYRDRRDRPGDDVRGASISSEHALDWLNEVRRWNGSAVAARIDHQKAIVAGIPVVASVSAPSSLAVQLARELRLTLIGFLRGNRFVVYAGDDRVAKS